MTDGVPGGAMNAPAGTPDRGGAPLQAPVYRERPWRQRHVHLGLGAFSRAHILVYADKLLAAGQSDWGVVGANLRSDDITSKLGRQDGLYTLVQSDGAHASAQVIGSLGAALGGADRPATIERLSDPNVAFVTVTVSEKGYGYDASRRLDLTLPAIADDLVHPAQPSSLVGALVEALLRRRQAKAPALTIASCDNIAGNGELLRALVLSFAERRDPTLVEWVERNATFPSTMVDRIVPATTDRLRTLAKELTGSEDPAAVGAEPFSQWVIQSSFAGEHPPLDTVGVEVVDDVAPFEQMKLRVLNGLHSACAYLGPMTA